MARPLVMVVRETESLADSIQLLLETVGFRVIPESTVEGALTRLATLQRESVRAVVIACNQPRSEMLRAFPEGFPSSARDLPVLVVGDRAAGERTGWPANVRFIGLPFVARRFVETLDRATRIAPAPVATAT